MTLTFDVPKNKAFIEMVTVGDLFIAGQFFGTSYRSEEQVHHSWPHLYSRSAVVTGESELLVIFAVPLFRLFN